MFSIDLGKIQIVFKNRRKFQSNSTVDYLEQSRMLYDMEKKLEIMEKLSK